MKARKDMHERPDLPAELYHRDRIEALRAEGDRLRAELRQCGVDPTLIIHAAKQSRRGTRQN
jgi:hypothetical protein